MTPTLRLALPLCLLFTACDREAAPVVTDTDVAIVEAAPDSAASPDAEIDAAVAEQVGDAAAVGEPEPVETPALAPAPAPMAEEAATETPADLDELVNGTGGDGVEIDEDGTELYDMAAPPLAFAFSDVLYSVAGSSGGSLRVERGDTPSAGTFTRTARGQDDVTGTWTLEGGTLTLGGVRYTIRSRESDGMTFSGPDGDLKLINTAG